MTPGAMTGDWDSCCRKRANQVCPCRRPTGPNWTGWLAAPGIRGCGPGGYACCAGEDALDTLLQELQEPAFLLVLDGVQDPHNLGACLRTADAAGVHAVIAPKDRAVGLTPVACKVASGAAETVPFIQVTNLSRTLRQLREACGLWVVGMAGEAEQSLYQTDLSGGLVMVMGGEEKGMRRLVREQCDLLLSVPMRGTVESLNVSVATAVGLFEAVRQRG